MTQPLLFLLFQTSFPYQLQQLPWVAVHQSGRGQQCGPWAWLLLLRVGMMLLVVAGDMVLMLVETMFGGSSYITPAEGLVVAMHDGTEEKDEDHHYHHS